MAEIAARIKPLERKLAIMIKTICLALMVFVLLGCGNEITRLSDDDLRKKVQDCDYGVGLSTLELQVCENYHRECKRRLKKEGRFVCN